MPGRACRAEGLRQWSGACASAICTRGWKGAWCGTGRQASLLSQFLCEQWFGAWAFVDFQIAVGCPGSPRWRQALNHLCPGVGGQDSGWGGGGVWCSSLACPHLGLQTCTRVWFCKWYVGSGKQGALVAVRGHSRSLLRTLLG